MKLWSALVFHVHMMRMIVDSIFFAFLFNLNTTIHPHGITVIEILNTFHSKYKYCMAKAVSGFHNNFIESLIDSSWLGPTHIKMLFNLKK